MERAVCPEREVLRAFSDVRWDVGRADLFTLAGVVLRAVVEERALREYLDDRERGEVIVPDDRHGELPAADLLFDENALVVLQRLLDRRRELALCFDDRCADARSASHRLDESGQPDRSSRLEVGRT